MLYQILQIFNYCLAILFTVMYFYQMVYVVIALVCKLKHENKVYQQHKYAVIIAARNERNVVGHLIDSVRSQDYPQELVDIFVIADNCTDDTAEVCRSRGAIVYERFNKELVGKGYALEYLFDRIKAEHADRKIEAFLILDADNILEDNYLTEMNKVFDNGYKVVTSYRNSKNFDTNWISSGYGIWFLREAKYLNNVRMMLHTSCAISGTGFLIASDVLEQYGGWKFHLLTEDVEFSIRYAIDGGKIGYAEKAMFYDEQPTTFKQSWNQRMRWAKGFYQVFGAHGGTLLKKMFTNFSCYDLLMTITPALLISLGTLFINAIFLIIGLIVDPALSLFALQLLGLQVGYYYGWLFLVGVLTVATEWKRIQTSAAKKIFYCFTFPLFMFTYVPISLAALFKKVKWTPIHHNFAKTLGDIKGKHAKIENKPAGEKPVDASPQGTDTPNATADGQQVPPTDTIAPTQDADATHSDETSSDETKADGKNSDETKAE